MVTSRKESLLDRDISRELKRLNAAGQPIHGYKTHGSAYQRAGVPDWHVTYKGQSIWVECKREGEHATRLQALELSRLKRAGAIVGVVRSIGDFREILASAGLDS